MRVVKNLADNRDPDSLATKLRQKRFAFFVRLLESVPRPLKILDVGGTQSFWERIPFTADSGVEIVILNLSITGTPTEQFSYIAGDATDMRAIGTGEFDVVFSNSVIEHVGSLEQQRRMAEEVQRVGKRYFVQTPHRYFPLEPHFLLPYFQFWPLAVRVFLVRHFNVGWYKKIPDKHLATKEVASIRLLTEREIMQLFPGSTIYKEKFLGLTKSLIAYDGWT
jgi:hypothetical protein